MSDYTKIATSYGDQYLAQLAETQEAFLKAWAPAKEWASTIKMPPATGFAADFPTPQEVAEANFAFATKLLKQQKKFADQLFASFAPAAQ